MFRGAKFLIPNHRSKPVPFKDYSGDDNEDARPPFNWVGTSKRSKNIQLLTNDDPDGPGTDVPIRVNKYGELMCQSGTYSFADEGSYRVATNRAPGSEVIALVSTSTAFSDTAAFFVIYNGNPNKRVHLQYAWFVHSADLSGNAHMWNFAFILDKANRTPTSNFSNTISTYTNMDVGQGGLVNKPLTGSFGVPSGTLLYTSTAAGMIVPARSSSAVIASRVNVVRNVSGATNAGSSFMVQFGNVNTKQAIQGLTGTDSGSRMRTSSTAPPIVIGYDQYCVCHLWANPLTVTNTFDFIIAWVER